MRFVTAFAISIASTFCIAGEISVSDVEIKQDISTRIVTVSYTLGANPAIVTVDFLTNSVSIGEENFSNVKGDVNRLVTGGGRHTITWQPQESWPDRLLGPGVLTAAVTAHAKDDPPDYLVVALTEEEDFPGISYYVSTNALPDGGLANDIYRTSRIVMRRIRAAGVRWRMGAVKADYSGAASDLSVGNREKAHGVTLSEDYFIGIYEVTQAQGAKFGGKGNYHTSYEDSPMRPSSNVKYETIRGSGTGNGHAVKSGSALYKLRTLTGIDFDLPTSAQWEYACRAGTTTLLYTGKPLVNASVYEVGWIYGNSAENGVRSPKAVGRKMPNAWGIYDMLGNCREWCLDTYNATPSPEDVVDPVGPADVTTRVFRGGDYSRTLKDFRASASWSSSESEDKFGEMFGYRLMCPIALKFN